MARKITFNESPRPQFVRDNYEIPEVPPWAIKLILEPNDI
jgi:hypothetical protein